MSDNNTPRPALQVQQEQGAATATSERASTVMSWASSELGRGIILAILLPAALLIRLFTGGFWDGFIAGLMILLTGWMIGGAKKNASPAIKKLIWGWPQILQAIGLAVIVSVWMFSGTAKNVDKSFTKGDLHAACDAADFKACKALKAMNLEKAEARAALADAYGQKPVATASSSTAGTAVVVAPPSVQYPVVTQCDTVPEHAVICEKVTIWPESEGGKAHLVRVPKGACLFEDRWQYIKKTELSGDLIHNTQYEPKLDRRETFQVFALPIGYTYMGSLPCGS